MTCAFFDQLRADLPGVWEDRYGDLESEMWGVWRERVVDIIEGAAELRGDAYDRHMRMHAP